MKKTLIALASLFALTSCEEGYKAPDGYKFEAQSQRLSPSRQISVVTYSSMADLRRAYEAQPNARPLAAGRELQAFSAYNSRTCTIHMIDPAVTYMPEFFGHELVHCLYGEFHPSQND